MAAAIPLDADGMEFKITGRMKMVLSGSNLYGQNKDYLRREITT